MAMPLNSCMAIPSFSYTQNHAFSIYRNSLSSISPPSLCAHRQASFPGSSWLCFRVILSDTQCLKASNLSYCVCLKGNGDWRKDSKRPSQKARATPTSVRTHKHNHRSGAPWVWATTGLSGPHETPGSLGGSCQVSPSSLQACASSWPPSPPLTILGTWLCTSCLPDTSHWGRPAPAQSRMFLSIWEKQSAISWVLQPLAHSSAGPAEVIPVFGSIWLKSWIWRPSWAWLSVHMSPSLQIWSYTDSPGLQNPAPGKRAWPFPSGAPWSITRVKSSPSSTPPALRSQCRGQERVGVPVSTCQEAHQLVYQGNWI